MRRLFTLKLFFASLPIAVAQFILSFLQLFVLPDKNMLAFLFILMTIDLCTGVTKAIFLKQNRTSSGFRKSIVKFYQYVGVICAGMFLTSILKYKGFDNTYFIFDFVTHWVVIFLIYIETVSILENIQALDSKSKVAKFLFEPLLMLLTLELSKFSNRVKKMVKDENDTHDSDHPFSGGAAEQ